MYWFCLFVEYLAALTLIQTVLFPMVGSLVNHDLREIWNEDVIDEFVLMGYLPGRTESNGSLVGDMNPSPP